MQEEPGTVGRVDEVLFVGNKEQMAQFSINFRCM